MVARALWRMARARSASSVDLFGAGGVRRNVLRPTTSFDSTVESRAGRKAVSDMVKVGYKVCKFLDVAKLHS